MNLTTTAADLLPAICDPENFGDDALRLAYADLLEEEGEADRAEFVRVQVARLRWPHRQRAGVIRAAIGEVLTGLILADGRGAGSGGFTVSGHRGPRWSITSTRRNDYLMTADGQPDWWNPRPRCRVILERGFVAEVACTCADWLAHGPALVRAQPVEAVRLTGTNPRRYEFPRDRDTEPYWRWFDGSRRGEPNPPDADPDELPFCLWSEYARLCDRAGVPWEHPTEADARHWLSEACLSWARSTGPTP